MAVQSIIPMRKPLSFLITVSILATLMVLAMGCDRKSEQQTKLSPPGQAARQATGVVLEDDLHPPDDPHPGGVEDWGNGMEMEEGEDSRFLVIEKRQLPGKMVDTGAVSSMTGQPIQAREPSRYVIVCEGNVTGERKAFILPESDYRIVRVGNQLRRSTLERWETISLETENPSQSEAQTLPPSIFDQQTGSSRSGRR